MTRNATLRKIADKLPAMNKMDAHGKFMYNEKGCAIRTDHFKEMVKIKRDLEKSLGVPRNSSEWMERYKLETKCIGEYTMAVQNTWNEIQRQKRIKLYKTIMSATSLCALAFYLWYRYI